MRPLLFMLFSLCISFACFAQSSEQLAYIEQFKDIAILEMDRAGIPASIKLAQGLLESAAGTSFLARRGNNHFGIKCGSQWDGKTLHREDDDYDEFGKLQKSCFRVYRSAEESFIAHSEFLRDERKSYRYGFLFRIDPTDYKSWAKGLKKSGYATSATYDKKLISIIERFDLHKFDLMSSPDIFTEISPTHKEDDIRIGITHNNDVKVIVASSDDTPFSISQRTGVSLDKLRKYNEELPGRSAAVGEGNLVYLQSKRNFYRGDRKWHYVQPGETMYKISQMYGMKLKKLYSRNMMPEGSQPAAGEKLRLRGRTRNEEDRPKLISEAPNGGIAYEDEMEFEDDFWSPEIPVVERDTETTDPIPDLEEDEEFLDEIEVDPNLPDPSPEVIDPIEPPADDNIEPAQPENVYHTVIKGDTLYSLSRRYGTTVDAIKQLNGLDSNLISVGQQLRIK
ncbi:MAG: LysM peptidoglycan-binding domain-containing protein [Bacteroidetes bacterium]|nr:LysM peptidoglycan-binding domain-containing protein [Bacteroidota bacterium]